MAVPGHFVLLVSVDQQIEKLIYWQGYLALVFVSIFIPFFLVLLPWLEPHIQKLNRCGDRDHLLLSLSISRKKAFTILPLQVIPQAFHRYSLLN